MEKFLQDLRFALRVYAKNRSFTIVAVLVLAIGIGSNIAVFTVVNAMLVRSLPYPDGDRLVQVGRRRSRIDAAQDTYVQSPAKHATRELLRAREAGEGIKPGAQAPGSIAINE